MTQAGDIDPNQSAFPSTRDTQTWGLTKRELFAAMLLQGILANDSRVGTSMYPIIAQNAAKLADALIEALNREEE